jgi:hypothetical protein
VWMGEIRVEVENEQEISSLKGDHFGLRIFQGCKRLE